MKNRSDWVAGTLRRSWAILCVLSAAIALISSIGAQTIAGNWQATLSTGQRIVLKIAPSKDGSLHGTLVYLDQLAAPLSLLSLTFQSPELDFACGPVIYQGTLSADGKSLVGTWTMGKQGFPLTFALATPETLWVSTVTRPAKMTAVDPSYSVASVKPVDPTQPASMRFRWFDRNLQATSVTVDFLLRWAYHLHRDQLQGGPPWMTESRFDVTAEPDAPGQPSAEKHRLMVRKLLADRFHLVVHETTQEMPAYVVTMEKKPLKIVPVEQSPSGVEAQIMLKDEDNGDQTWQFVASSLHEFFVQGTVDRPVIDQAGLDGFYDFAVRIPAATAHGETDAPTRSDAFLSGLKQLGLGVTPKKMPVRVLVVDRLEKPTAN